MYEPMIYENQVVWITGASSGIGEALAVRMAARGAKVVLSARNKQELERVAARCLEKGASDVLVLPLDVADHDSLAAKAEQVLSRFGHVDLLINNAGVTRDNLMLRMNEEMWDIVLDNNLKSVF